MRSAVNTAVTAVALVWQELLKLSFTHFATWFHRQSVDLQTTGLRFPVTFLSSPSICLLRERLPSSPAHTRLPEACLL